MPAHRKRGLTRFNGPETVPSVGFPALPRRRERVTMPRIVGASSPGGKAVKPISVAPFRFNMA